MSNERETEAVVGGIAVKREWLHVFTVRNGRLARQDGFNDIGEAETALSSAG